MKGGGGVFSCRVHGGKEFMPSGIEDNTRRRGFSPELKEVEVVF